MESEAPSGLFDKEKSHKSLIRRGLWLLLSLRGAVGGHLKELVFVGLVGSSRCRSRTYRSTQPSGAIEVELPSDQMLAVPEVQML